jgi:hypothetical protein
LRPAILIAKPWNINNVIRHCHPRISKSNN